MKERERESSSPRLGGPIENTKKNNNTNNTNKAKRKHSIYLSLYRCPCISSALFITLPLHVSLVSFFPLYYLAMARVALTHNPLIRALAAIDNNDQAMGRN